MSTVMSYLHIIIDAVLIIIVAVCAYRGFRTGLINGICGILAVVIAIYGGALLARVYSPEFTGMLEPFASGIIDKQINEIVFGETSETETETGIGAEEKANKKVKPDLSKTDLTKVDLNKFDFDAFGLEREKVEEIEESGRGVYIASYVIVRDFGIPERPADSVAAQTAGQINSIGQEFSVILTKNLCDHLTFAAVFFIAFLLIFLIFSAVGSLLNLSFGIPGLENVNHILGGILGVAKGILLILVIGCLLRYVCILLPEGIVDKTWVMKKIVTTNILADILKL